MNTLLENASLWQFFAAGALLLLAFQATLFWAVRAQACSAKQPRSRWKITLLQGLASAALLALYLALYMTQGKPEALLPTQGEQFEAKMQASVNNLAARLQASPDDAAGWLTMARTHSALGRYAEAAQAYEQAKSLAWQSPSLLVAWAEVRLLAHDRNFDARTQEIVAHAAVLAPENPEVLLLTGLAAMERGDLRLAQTTLQALRAHYPPGGEDLEAVESALEALRQGLNPRTGERTAAPPSPP